MTTTIKTRELTPSEESVLAHVAEGSSNVEIAHELYLSTNTIKFHLKNIYAKLQVENRTQAARWYWDHQSTSNGHE